MGRPQAVPPEKGLLSSSYVNSSKIKKAGLCDCTVGLLTVVRFMAITFGVEENSRHFVCGVTKGVCAQEDRYKGLKQKFESHKNCTRQFWRGAPYR